MAALAGLAALLIAPKLARRPKVALTALACLLAPLALYAYLPWAASSDPYLNWGDPSSWDGFVEHVTRSQYAAVEASSRATTSYTDYLARLGVLWDALLRQFGAPWVGLLAVLGFFTLAVRRTGLWLLLITLGWLCSVGITQYASYSMGREHVYAVAIFFIPAWMVLSFLVGGGLDALLLAARRRWSERGMRASAIGAAVLLIGLPGLVNLPHVDRSETTLVADYGRALLDAMEPGSLYFPSSDHSTFSVLYWQGVEGYRTDVVIADKYGSIDEQLIAEHLSADEQAAADMLPGSQRRARWEMLLTQRWAAPVYFAGRRVMSDLPGYTLEPAGPLFRVMAETEAEQWWATSVDESLVGPVADPPGLAAWAPLAALDLDDPAEGLDFTVQMIRSDLHAMKGFALLRASRLDEAETEWAAIRGDLAPLKQVFNNIGSALADQGRTGEALAYYDRALAEDASYALALRNAAAVHRRRGEASAAIGKLRQLVRLESSARTERLLLARALGSDGQIEASLAQYEALARQDLTDPLPWREAGKLLEQGGDYAKARDAFTESLARDADQPLISQALDRIKKGVSQMMAQQSPGLGLPNAMGSWLSSEASHDLSLDPHRVDFGSPPMPRLPGGGTGLLSATPRPPSPSTSQQLNTTPQQHPRTGGGFP